MPKAVVYHKTTLNQLGGPHLGCTEVAYMGGVGRGRDRSEWSVMHLCG